MTAQRSTPSQTTLADTQQNIAILLYRVDELSKSLAETTSEMQCEFKELRTALKGNGKPGIEQRTADLERDSRTVMEMLKDHNASMLEHFNEHSAERKDIEKRREELDKERRDLVNKIILAVIGMIATNLGAIITAVVLYRLGVP